MDLAIEVIAEVPLPPGVERIAFREQVGACAGVGLSCHSMPTSCLSSLSHTSMPDLPAQLLCFLDGLFGLPLALPGSSVARALAAKEELVAALGPLVAADRQRMAKRVGRDAGGHRL